MGAWLTAASRAGCVTPAARPDLCRGARVFPSPVDHSAQRDERAHLGQFAFGVNVFLALRGPTNSLRADPG